MKNNHDDYYEERERKSMAVFLIAVCASSALVIWGVLALIMWVLKH